MVQKLLRFANRNKLILTLVVLVIATLTINRTIFAQLDEADQASGGVLGLSIVPAISDHPIKPGKSSSFDITVTNITNSAIPIIVGSRPLADVAESVDDAIRFRYDASRWLEPDRTSLIVGPDGTETITIDVNPPSDAGPGGHYAQIYFRALSPEVEPSQTSATVNPELVTLVLMSVPGELDQTLELSLDPVSFLSINPSRTFTATLKNKGNTHLLTTNKVIISNPLSGGEVEVEIPLESRLILPGTSVEVSTDWRPAEAGVYKATFETSFGTPLSVQTQTTRTFLIMPAFWAVVSTLLGVVVAITIIWRWLRSRLKKPKRFGRDNSGSLPLNTPTNNNFDNLGRDPALRDTSRRKRTG